MSPPLDARSAAPIPSTPASLAASAAFTCSICFELCDTRLLDELLCCHRICCRECLAAHGRTSRPSTCPCCREVAPAKRTVEDNVLYSRLANDVEVACPGEGCAWKGGLRDFWRAHRERCSAVRGPCFLGCGSDVSGAEMREHLAVCPRNVVTCDICGATSRPGAEEEHRRAAAEEHVRLLTVKCQAAEARAVAGEVLLASALSELRRSLDRGAELTSRLAMEAGSSFCWLLATPPDWEHGGHETQPYATSAGASFWLSLETSAEGANVFLCADGPVHLKGAALTLQAPAGVDWRAEELRDVDVVPCPRGHGEDEEDEDSGDEDFRAEEPVASWRRGAAEGPPPRCFMTLKVRELYIY